MKIASDLIRFHKTLHTWVGIVAGSLLFIGFFAGSLTLFKEPLDRWVRSGAAPLAADWGGRLDDALVPDLLARHPEAAANFSVHLVPTEVAQAPISWPLPAVDEAALSPHQVALRGADGRLEIATQAPTALGELIDLLHRTGGLPGFIGDEHAGVYVMGVAAVLYVLALVSGVVVLLPTLARDFFALRRGANRKRWWLDLHNLLGITSLPFHLVIALTVIVFAFHDPFYGALRRVVYGAPPGPHATQPSPLADAHLMPLSQVLARIAEEAPGFGPTELRYVDALGQTPMLRVSLAHPDALVRGPRTGYLILDPRSGATLDASMLPGRQNGWSAPVNAAFALHFGSYGGELVRWSYFALGWMGSALFYTGNLLWLESRRRRGRAGEAVPTRRRSLHWVAAGTVGTSLGCVLGVALALAVGKWLHGGSVALSLGIYYAAATLSLAWACGRGAARAAPVLLAAAALASAALAVLSWRDGSGLLRALAGGDSGGWAVDGVALLLAAALLVIARRTWRRVRLSPPDSIWSLAPLAPFGRSAEAA